MLANSVADLWRYLVASPNCKYEFIYVPMISVFSKYSFFHPGFRQVVIIIIKLWMATERLDHLLGVIFML